MPRVLAALVFAPALLALLWFGGAPLSWTCVGLCALMYRELEQMALRAAPWPLRLLGWCTVGATLTFVLGGVAPALALPAATGPFAERTALVATTLLLSLYASALLPLVAVLRARPVDGLELATLAVFVSWAADTGAYFAGRSFGRRKLAPSLSPKKTWEGALGGLALALFFCAVWGWILPAHTPRVHWFVVSALATALGTLGDLTESLLKRSFNAKDSSQMIPGHGGVLDRFDSVLFASWAVFAYASALLPQPG